MAKLKEIPLGEAGIAYVKSCLQQGTGLCAKIIERSFLDGAAFAPPPEGVSLERAKKFEVGGLTSRRDTIPWLVDHVQDSVGGDSEGTMIFQDIWAKPTDPGIRHSTSNHFFQDSNVYFYLAKNEIDRYSLTEVLRTMKSFLFVAMYSTCSLSNDVA